MARRSVCGYHTAARKVPETTGMQAAAPVAPNADTADTEQPAAQLPPGGATFYRVSGAVKGHAQCAPLWGPLHC
jgi:hypothetical protein